MTDQYRINLQKRWSIFLKTCQSLTADGLNYSVLFNLTGDQPHIVITASGQTTRKRKLAPLPKHGMSCYVKATQCAIHALEAEWFLPENRSRRNSNPNHWRTRRTRHDELAAMAEETLRNELAYWREMELLSGQRERMKPGLSDETRYFDDEVAA